MPIVLWLPGGKASSPSQQLAQFDVLHGESGRRTGMPVALVASNSHFVTMPASTAGSLGDIVRNSKIAPESRFVVGEHTVLGA
jgi:hypothetical protein